MKKFKKLTALLLAGAMTMLLLASCNGGGGGGNPASFEQQVEDAFFSVYSKEVGMTTNDPEAKALAETSFDCIKPADGNFYLNMEDENHNVLTNKWSKVDKAQGIMMYALPLPEDSNVDLMSGFHYKVREITSEMLRNMDISSVTSAYKSALKGFTDKGAEVTAIGVAAKTINGKTYVSLGVKMKISLSDSNGIKACPAPEVRRPRRFRGFLQFYGKNANSVVQ